MNGSFTYRVQGVVFVEVFKPIQLDPLNEGTIGHTTLQPGDYGECLVVRLGTESNEDWVLFPNESEFGKKLNLLLTLGGKKIVEVCADARGRPYSK
jgi:hypothetical protein